MMEKTWRWFGKKDKITLPMLRQIGVEGIVTALHDVPNGEIWTKETPRYTQIGNAIPPLFGEQAGCILDKIINNRL